MIGEERKVELPRYGEGLKCTYPAEQARRGEPGRRIEAGRFREGEVADRDRDRDRGRDDDGGP